MFSPKRARILSAKRGQSARRDLAQSKASRYTRFYVYGSDNNVGLYGRYCGGGQPDGEWWDLARNGNYQPKDPIDALCMDHDRQEALHALRQKPDVDVLIIGGGINGAGIARDCLATYMRAKQEQGLSDRLNSRNSPLPSRAKTACRGRCHLHR